jgi:hypothetical protein
MNRVIQNMPLSIDPRGADQANINRQLTEVIRQLWLKTNEIEKTVITMMEAVATLQLTTNSLVNAANKITRITAADSPYTVALFDRNIFADTDDGAVNVLFRPGVNETRLTIKNCGISGNNVTCTPSGTEFLFGVNLPAVLTDAQTLDLQYETTEGWY